MNHTKEPLIIKSRHLQQSYFLTPTLQNVLKRFKISLAVSLILRCHPLPHGQNKLKKHRGVFMSQNDLTIKSSITKLEVSRYVVDKIVVESNLEKRLRAKTAELPRGGMISSSDVGALLGLLGLTVNTKKAIEIGTFTGYTALKMAGILPSDGKLVCCDISGEWAAIGQPFWREAKVDSKIDLRLAPAVKTLEALLNEGQAGSYDFAFIDADKIGYDNYYELCLQLLRPGGLIVLDNMLWDGSVADESIQDETTNALRALNQKISQDSRVTSCLLTVGDGLMLARKK